MDMVENVCIVIATNGYNESRFVRCMTFTQRLAPIYVPLEDAEFVFCHPSQLSHASVRGLNLELTFFFFRTYFYFIFFLITILYCLTCLLTKHLRCPGK